MRRIRLLHFVLTIPLAFFIISGLTALGLAGSCGSDGDWSACGVVVSVPISGGGGGGGGGGNPTPTATPDPVYPWDTYPSQGWSGQQLASFSMQDGRFYGAWFHGFVEDSGTIDNPTYFNYSIGGTHTYMVITHGAGVNVPVSWLPVQYENIYGGVNSTPLIHINGSLDGCENPYPTPTSCTFGPMSNDPFGSNSDDFTIQNFATYPLYAVFYAHGTLHTEAAVDVTDVFSSSGTQMDWNHQVVTP